MTARLWISARRSVRRCSHRWRCQPIRALSELLGVGDFGEVERRAGTLVERFVDHGTPTMLNWTLSMSGLSAELSGDHERAIRLADDAAEEVTPEGTLPVNGPMETRSIL